MAAYSVYLRSTAVPERVGRLNGGDVLSFLIPAALTIQLHFVGQLSLSDILFVLIFPPLLVSGERSIERPQARTFLVLGLLWLYGQIATDLYVGTRFHDLARGWSNILLTVVGFQALVILLDGRTRRFFMFAAGLAVGFVGQYLTSGGSGDPWKFGFAEPVAIFVVLFVSRPRVRRVPLLGALCLGAVAVVNLLLDFRSLALIAFLSALYLAVAGFRGRRQSWRRRSPLNWLMWIACALAATVAFSEAYGYSARAGWLSPAAEQKYTRQASDPYGLLAGGRPEFRAAFHAIEDSPLLGHGSWPRDTKYEKYLVTQYRSLAQLDSGSGLIPTHSYLTGAWVDAGVLGAVIWVWVFGLVARVMSREWRTNDALTPLVVFAGISLAWAIPFSPYAGAARTYVPFYVLLLLFSLERDRSPARVE